jgi:Zn-dependent M28 family amino/carboxypeptidase
METGIVIVIIVLALGCGLFYITKMPNVGYVGPAAGHEVSFERLESRVKAHVESLSTESVGRNMIYEDTLTPAGNYIARSFEDSGFPVRRQEYDFQGDTFANLEVELVGETRPKEVLVVGAHYDTVAGAPGANDNGSGVAALLELVRLVSKHTRSRTVRFVAFCNEEPPFFQSDGMGSHVYVSNFPHDQLEIIGMISLETIGYYSEEPGSQKYPPPLSLLYPNKGTFLAFVGNLRSRRLMIDSLSLFRRHSPVPSEGIAAPAFIPGVSWSDQWSFWNHGHQAIMVTDTAPYRYPDYHRSSDTPDKIDYGILAQVVVGLSHVIVGLANDSDAK